MKPGFQQCLEILSKFLLILENIDQEHVTCVFLQNKRLGHVAPNPGCKHDFPDAGIFTNSWAH